MLLICDDFSRFTWTYFMRQKSDTVALFEQFLADECVAGTPSAVKMIRSDEMGELKGDFVKLCRKQTSARSSLLVVVRNLTGQLNDTSRW